MAESRQPSQDTDSVKAFFRVPGTEDAAVESAIRMANRIICDNLQGLAPETLAEIELNLACYFLSAKTGMTSSEKIGDAQDNFIVEDGVNPYWQSAVMLDTTGRLARLKGKRTIFRGADFTPIRTGYY